MPAASLMLETRDLLLHQISAEDIDMYMKMYKCPVTTKYLPNGAPYSDQQIVDYLKKRIDHWQRGFGTFTIKERLTSEKVGYVGIEVSPVVCCSDIRYGIDRAKWGRGYAYEAARECLRFTFNQKKHTKIYGAAVEANQASIRVLQKLGMVPEMEIDLYGCPDLVYLSVSRSTFFNGSQEGQLVTNM